MTESLMIYDIMRKEINDKMELIKKNIKKESDNKEYKYKYIYIDIYMFII